MQGVEDLIKLNIGTQQVREFVESKTGKVCTAQDVHNLRAKLRKQADGGRTQGEMLVDNVEKILKDKHLKKCFENLKIEPFPPSAEPNPKRQENIQIKEINCICRMPEFSRCKGFYNPERDVNLVECEGCKKWFHPSCKKISKKYLNSDLEYFCGKKCKTNSA